LNRPFARRHARHPFLYEAIVRFEDPHRGSEQAAIFTRDRTGSHIAFLTTERFELGQLVHLDFTHLPATEALRRIPGRVRRCRQCHEGWFDCLVQVGVTARHSPSLWERAARWIGEMTGFGPDDRRGHGRSRRRAA
jgi:hypothetical protein